MYHSDTNFNHRPWTEKKSKITDFNERNLKTSQSDPECYSCFRHCGTNSARYPEIMRSEFDKPCGDCQIQSELFKLNISEHSTNGEGDNSSNTYRCVSSIFGNSSTARKEKRCKIIDTSEQVESKETNFRRERSSQSLKKCPSDVFKVVQASTTSRSSSATCVKITGKPISRQISYEFWLYLKNVEARKRKQQKDLELSKEKEERERLLREKEEKRRMEKEMFMKWASEKKKKKAECRKAMEKNVKYFNELQNLQDGLADVKNIQFKCWLLKKEAKRKEIEEKREMREKEKEGKILERKISSAEAFEKWQQKSKNTPRPLTQSLFNHSIPPFIQEKEWNGIIVTDQ